MTNLIKLENLTKVYYKDDIEIIALDDVNLEFNKGDFAVIVGPSGSGKSTLLRLMGGIDRPSYGKVIINGEDITIKKETKLAIWRRKNIGFVFQDYNLLQALTARENIILPMTILGIDFAEAQKKADDLLDMVGLTNRAAHYPSELSGGEQQRVAIARALANDPLVLLCDEPTGNIDTTTSKKIIDLLYKINKELNMTCIIVTHDPQIAEKAKIKIELKSNSTE